MISWPGALDAEVARIAGPFDESDEVNHDPDSFVGEEDETGFDDDPGGAEPQFADDDGLDDAGGPEEDDEDETEEDEGEDDE